MALRQLGDGVFRRVEKALTVNDLSLRHQPVVVLVHGVANQVNVGLLHLLDVDKRGAGHRDRSLHDHQRSADALERLGGGSAGERSGVVAPFHDTVAVHVDNRRDALCIQQVGLTRFIRERERDGYVGTSIPV